MLDDLPFIPLLVGALAHGAYLNIMKTFPDAKMDWAFWAAVGPSLSLLTPISLCPSSVLLLSLSLYLASVQFSPFFSSSLLLLFSFCVSLRSAILRRQPGLDDLLL
jgi:hypothetical protein